MAVLELDPRYNGPKMAKVLRLMEDGSYKQAFEGLITPSTPCCATFIRNSTSPRSMTQAFM